jgi:ABC-2 type transport system ATP-binding protein
VAAVRADALSFRYAGAPEPALERVSFEVAGGEVFGVLGPNGAGKTTLMKLVSTVFAPQSGRLEVLGEALPGNEERVRSRLGVAFAEYERAFSFRLTGRQNLDYFAALYDVPRRETRARVDAVLATVQLTGKADALFQSYSTGMKHRLALARALLPAPELLVLDEPTAGLDAQTTRELGATLRGLADQGTAILYTTHRLEEAASLCDRVLVLKQGKAAAMAAPWELARLARDVTALDVEVKGMLPESTDALRKLPGVVSVRAEGRARLRLQVTDVDAATRAVLAWLEREKLPLASLSASSATLSDAFVAITEGRLHDAPAPEAR